MADLRYKISKHMHKDSKAAKVVVWVLVVMFILSSLSFITLAAGTNGQKYSLDEISRAAATVWSRDGSSHTDDDAAAPADALINMSNITDAHIAANFMGYAENHEVAVASTANSITISYESLQNYRGAYGYAMYGHMLNMLGYDTIVQTGASQQDSSATATSRRLQGTLLLGSYMAHKSYTSLMRLSLETLQKLNVFRYLYQYAVTVTDQEVVLNGNYTYTWTDYDGNVHTENVNNANLAVSSESYNAASGVDSQYVSVDQQSTNYQGTGVTLSAEPDSPTLFQKAMRYIARLYSLLFNIGWTIVLPFLLVILGVVFMMYTRNVSKGRPSNTLWPHIKKIIVYILWLTLIIPVTATLYTAALDSMVADMEDSDSTQLADNIILSTLVDFRTWSTVDGLNWNDIGKNYIMGGDNIQFSVENSEGGILTPDSYFIIRDRAYNLNRALGYGGAGQHSVFGSSIDDYFTTVETQYNSATFDLTGDPLTSSLLGVNTNVNTQATLNDETNALQLLLTFLTNETIDSASIASSQQAILNSYSDADGLQQYWDAAINTDTYSATTSTSAPTDPDADTEGYSLMSSSAGYGIGPSAGPIAQDVFTTYNGHTLDGSLVILPSISTDGGLMRHLVDDDVWFFPSNGTRTDRSSKTDTSNTAYGGFSALGLYNYLSTDFSSSDSITIYNNSEGRNITTNVNHYAVSAVGTGTLRWLYVLEACGFMLACAIIGIFYCMSMFLSTMKHSIQAMLALVKGVMSDVTSMVKAVVLAFWMCIDIIITVSLYKILTELLVGMSSLIERTLLKLIMGTDWGNAVNLTGEQGGNLVMILICVIRIIAFFGIIIIAIKLRKSFVKSLTETFEVIVDRIVGARTSVSNQGTPYADAAKRGAANIATGMLIGAQNTVHGLTGSGGVSGFLGSTVKLLGGAGTALAVGGAASGWLDGAANNVVNSMADGANQMMSGGADAAVQNAAAEQMANNTNVINNGSSDAVTSNFSSDWQAQQDFADSFANQITEDIDNGVINPNNTLEENASIINDTTNDILNGGSETSATQSAVNNTTNSTTQNGDVQPKNADAPQKGSSKSTSDNRSTVIQNNSNKSESVQNSNSDNRTNSVDNTSSKQSSTTQDNARNSIIQQNRNVDARNAATGRGSKVEGVDTTAKTLGQTQQSVRGAASGASQVVNGNHRVETSTQIRGNNNVQAPGRRDAQTPSSNAANRGAHKSNELSKQNAGSNKTSTSNTAAKRQQTLGTIGTQPAPAKAPTNVKNPSQMPNKAARMSQASGITPAQPNRTMPKTAPVNNRPVVNNQTVAKSNANRVTAARPVNAPVNIPNKNVRTTVRPSVQPTIKPSVNDKRVPRNKNGRRTG